ncbi:hypothetical protein [Alkalihalobacillus deserti]|uniref:hypothetical protein n=1 Tax=Alkalihalobacillus deserti TaxID=2879466 RepID=UPI001D138010|nr:hypothetical protein [Alkalihalobacillus deserti]
MKNLLIIYVEDLHVKCIFGPASVGTNIIFEQILYDYEFLELGFKTIEAEMAYDILVEQHLVDSELEKELTFYYESLLVGKSHEYTLLNPTLKQQLESILEQANTRMQWNGSTSSKNSEINEKVEDLIKRVKFHLSKYVVEEIILVSKSELAFWLEKPIQHFFNCSCIQVKELIYTISELGLSSNRTKQIKLRYLSGVYPIMELDSFDNEISGSVLFPVKFALDTHINLVVFEEWKDKGIRKERVLTQYSFYLPFFYTNDVIQFTAIYVPNKGYSFEVIHDETGEKDIFNYEDD